MKHTMLRIVAVLAVIACVAMGFAGCNKGGDDKLVIGCSGPLTGDAAQYGESVQRGAQIAVDEINAAGGINGFQIQFEMLDDQATADMATTMGHIKREELAKSEVYIPTLDEYSRIGKILSPIYDLIIANRIENKRLAALRDTLLPKLMSGDIDVSEVSI